MRRVVARALRCAADRIDPPKPKGDWHHMVVSHTGTSTTLYVDGCAVYRY